MKIILLVLTMIATLYAGDFHLYSVENKDGKINAKVVEEELKKNGFKIGENANIKAELLSIYGDKNFKLYNHISFYHSDISLKLLNKHANAGILIPSGIVMYQGIDEDILHIVVLRAELQAKVIGCKAEELEELESLLTKIITKLFPNAVHEYNKKSKVQTKKRLTLYSLDVDDGDIEDIREELEESFEEKFGEAGFAMPSYFDLTDDLGEDSPYEFYVTYALCKIDALRIVVKTHPESIVLGPCTTMIYKKKNEEKIVMGFASMYNWLSSAAIEDKDAVDALLEAQKIYEDILKDVTNN